MVVVVVVVACSANLIALDSRFALVRYGMLRDTFPFGFNEKSAVQTLQPRRPLPVSPLADRESTS